MVSIIMSAYNAENTISKAIDSCLNQTYKDIEIIVINDCSTDNTRQVVENLSSIDSRIRIINRDFNGGAGLAKQTGIKEIKGEYMMFLDSDDYLKLDYIETLFNALIEYDADIVTSGYIEVDTNGNIIKEKIPATVIQEGKNKYNPNKEHTKWYMNSMLIKSKLWNNVEYSSRILINDIPSLVKILYYANRVLTLEYAGYFYVQNPYSIQHTASNIKFTIFSLLSFKDMLEFFNSKGENLPYREFITQYCMLLNMDIDEEEYLLYKKELDELYNFYSLHCC